MPQITKVRIANFQYNNGKRIIADELYDFENKNSAPSDVLINLVNGGGKSVLVQLMMQPIIPKAKVAGRRIESFFTKSTDHCYVALEWALDNSKMKLLTGIAMAASDTSAESGSDRGFQIKYYTFISSYQDNQEKYSIVSLPLSKKENGKYVPALFDDIRNLAKRTNGKLVRYSSDDSMNWRETLFQYGIVQNEWRMIEELNSNEDGLSKYFANLKSSDALIDKLIIPRIEEKQNHSVSKDDSSLETMLIFYAKKYSAQQNIIKEREICKGFFDMLEGAKTEAETLWKSNDFLENGIANLFAYSDALENAISLRKQKYMQLEAEIDWLDKEVNNVRWEKASANYYTCKEAFAKRNENLRTAEFERDKTKTLVNEAKKKLLLMECAHYYEQLVEIESQITSITSEIEIREHNSESSQKLATLKYSAYCAILTELQHITPEIDSLSGHFKRLQTSIGVLDTELSDIRLKRASAKTTVDKAEATLDKQKQDNDKAVAELGIDTFRMLDGKYKADDLNKWDAQLLANMKATKGNIQTLDEKCKRLDERREAIPQEIADIKNEIKIAESDVTSMAREIAEYRSAEDKIKEICDKYSLDFDLRFTDYAQEYIEEQLSHTQADIKSETRKKEATEEAISAVDRGTLHIPKLVTDYLDGTGLHYTTFESYILAQQEKNLLSKEDGQKLLSLYPYAAYGVIVNESDLDTLFKEAEDKWLPAALPILTANEINQMMQGNHGTFRAIAAYAHDYFLDKEGYYNRLQASASGQNDYLELLAKKMENLKSDNLTVKAFSIYDKNWIYSKQTAKEKEENKIAENKAAIDKLKQEQDTNKKHISEIRNTILQMNSSLLNIQRQTDDFNILLRKLKEEEELCQIYIGAQKKLRDIQTIESEKSFLKQSQNTELADIDDKLKERKLYANSLNTGLSFVEEAEEADIITGEWNSLLEQYKALQEAQNADLKRLNEDEARLLNQKEEKEKEIQKRHCTREEYVQIIYSEEQEAEQTEAVVFYDKSYNEKESAYLQAYGDQKIANERYENSCTKLAEFGGEPLPENKVGKLFDKRIAEIKQQSSQLFIESKKCIAEQAKLEKTQGKAENAAESCIRPSKCQKIVLEQDFGGQLDFLMNKIKECKNSVDISSRKVEDILRKMAAVYGEFSADVKTAISSMQYLLSNEVVRGDRYFTLCEHIEANMHTAKLRISQIDTDLTEFHKTKGDLIHQCVIQGKQMYEGLMQLSNNSKVKVQEKRRQMLRFDIPKAIDENVANASISAEIDKGILELVAKLSEDGYADSEIRKIASRTVGSKRLLRKYIGTDNIILKAYKIDRNPNNSGYRTWEQTQVNNSGAEKFVVYFAVILALMAYARDDYDDIGSKHNRSVLILDNPFGPISSKHVLEPMFEISKNYNVQMICLSDISKSDIVSCFDLIIRAVVKQFALSTKEQLTHEGNELIEHGFYKSEQMNMF